MESSKGVVRCLMSCVVDVLRPFQRLLSCLSSVPRCVSWRSKAAMLAAYRSIWTFDEFLPSVLRILESRFAVLFRTGAGADSNVTFRAAAVFVFAAASPRPRFAGVFDWVRFDKLNRIEWTGLLKFWFFWCFLLLECVLW